MSDSHKPSAAAVKATFILLEDVEHDLQGSFSQRMRARTDIALALDAFSSTSVETMREALKISVEYFNSIRSCTTGTVNEQQLAMRTVAHDAVSLICELVPDLVTK